MDTRELSQLPTRYLHEQHRHLRELIVWMTVERDEISDELAHRFCRVVDSDPTDSDLGVTDSLLRLDLED